MNLRGFVQRIRLEVVLNYISVAVIAYILIVVAVRKLDQPQKPVGYNRAVAVGDELKIPGIKWPKQGNTLVFALQVGCKYCEKSMPFYRTLTSAIRKRADLYPVAVLPQTRTESMAYLAKNALTISDMYQANLMEVGLAGTPTLLLIDGPVRLFSFGPDFLTRKERKTSFVA